jgi:hypothetical protein
MSEITADASVSASPATGGGEGAAVIATTILVIEAGAALMASFCPSWFTVRSDFFHDNGAVEGNRTSIRHGYIAAAVLTMATGWASSVMVRSPLPMVGAALITGIEIAGYEYCVRHPAREAKGPTPAWQQALNWGAAGGGGGA